MSNIMVFDIETVPDVEQGRKLLNLPGVEDAVVRQALKDRRLEKTQGLSDFLPHYLQKIVAISVVVQTPAWVKVWSLGETHSSEKELIERFFQGVERLKPILVSWNGNGFDLPVLHYRSLLHTVVAPRYWDLGDDDPGFKWNNYLSRYHQRHTDLMDVLSGYQGRAVAPLDEISKILGFPGKMGMSGSDVSEQFEAGQIDSIRNYCETDVLNTYLIFLRFQTIRGRNTIEEEKQEVMRLQEYLKESGKSHLMEYLEIWQNNG